MKQNTTARIIISIVLFVIGTNDLLAQELNAKNTTEVNKWSFELSFGSNKAVRPFGTGYNSSEKSFFSFQNLNHFDFGFRYMLNSKFGIKPDIAFDIITNKLDNGSLPFRSLQYRIGFQGIVDLGKVFEFNTFSNTIGLLGHGGIQLSQFKSKIGVGNQEAVTESNRGFIIGITPQIKLSEHTVLTTDFSALTNLRQRLNWDGSVAAQENNLTGLLYSASIGLTFYLGKNERHSDWFIPKNISEINPEITQRLVQIETLLNDTDKDGVVDYLDAQNDTPSGVFVDSKGRFIDSNNNGTPDQFEPKTIEDLKLQDLALATEKSENNAFKSLLNNGLINVFYDVNEVDPNKGSTNSVYGVISLLKKNPSINVSLMGYSDKNGNEKANKNLSERRAKRLFDLFVLSGISESRLKIVGQGEDKITPSNSNLGLQLARRVSVILN